MMGAGLSTPARVREFNSENVGSARSELKTASLTLGAILELEHVTCRPRTKINHNGHGTG